MLREFSDTNYLSSLVCVLSGGGGQSSKRENPKPKGIDRTPNSGYVVGFRGCRKLSVDSFTFTKNKQSGGRTYWSCARAVQYKCKARVMTVWEDGEEKTIVRNNYHNHEPF